MRPVPNRAQGVDADRFAPLMLLIFVFCFIVTMSGCATPPEVKAMPLFTEKPNQPYKSLGDVFADDSDMNDAIVKLKKKAFELGANAVILKNQQTGGWKVSGGFGGGSVSRKVVLTGEAIRLQ